MSEVKLDGPYIDSALLTARGLGVDNLVFSAKREDGVSQLCWRCTWKGENYGGRIDTRTEREAAMLKNLITHAMQTLKVLAE